MGFKFRSDQRSYFLADIEMSNSLVINDSPRLQIIQAVRTVLLESTGRKKPQFSILAR